MHRYGYILGIAAIVAASATGNDHLRRSKGRDCDTAPPCVPAQPLAPSAMPGTQGQQPDPSNPNAPPSEPSPQSSAFNEALASAGEGGTQPAASLMPGFFGDVFGGVLRVHAAVPVNSSIGGSTLVNRDILSIDVSQASAIKIADSDSPRPLDRVYYLYNFFGNIPLDVAPNANPAFPLDVHRHVFGFERTFFDGNASIGMRLPFFSLAGDPAYQTGFVGDISVLTKFALINNRRTGNVLSVGFGVATPSGGTPQLLVIGRGAGRQPMPRDYPVILQPYTGYIYNLLPRLYFHGFHGVLIPTDSAEPTFMANDVGLGFWLYRNPDDGFVRGIVPTFEVHVNTPFNHREPTNVPGDVRMLDSVNLTSGFYVIFPRSVLGASVGVPVAYGPHTIEALASYSLRF